MWRELQLRAHYPDKARFNLSKTVEHLFPFHLLFHPRLFVAASFQIYSLAYRCRFRREEPIPLAEQERCALAQLQATCRF